MASQPRGDEEMREDDGSPAGDITSQGEEVFGGEGKAESPGDASATMPFKRPGRPLKAATGARRGRNSPAIPGLITNLPPSSGNSSAGSASTAAEHNPMLSAVQLGALYTRFGQVKESLDRIEQLAFGRPGDDPSSDLSTRIVSPVSSYLNDDALRAYLDANPISKVWMNRNVKVLGDIRKEFSGLQDPATAVKEMKQYISEYQTTIFLAKKTLDAYSFRVDGDERKIKKLKAELEKKEAELTESEMIRELNESDLANIKEERQREKREAELQSTRAQKAFNKRKSGFDELGYIKNQHELLEKTHAGLQEEFQKAVTELETAKSDHEKVNEQLQQTRIFANEMQSKADALEKTQQLKAMGSAQDFQVIEKLQAEVKTLQRQLKEGDISYRSLQAHAAQMTSSRDTNARLVETTATKLRKQISDLETNNQKVVDEAKGVINTLTEEKSRLLEEYTNHQNQIGKLENDIRAAREEISTKDRELDDAIQSVQSVGIEVRQLEQEVSDLRAAQADVPDPNRITELENEVQAVRAREAEKIAALQQQIQASKDHEATIDSLQQQLRDAQAKAEDASRIGELEKEIQAAKDSEAQKTSTLQQELQALQQQLHAAGERENQRIAELQTQLQNATARSEDANTIAQLQASLGAAQLNEANLMKEAYAVVGDLKQKLHDSSEKLREAEAEVARHRQDRDESSTKISDLEEQIKTLQSATPQADNVSDEVAKLKTQLDEAMEARQQALEKTNEAVNTIKDLEARNKSLTEEISALNKTIQTLRDKQSATTKERDDAQSVMAKALAQLSAFDATKIRAAELEEQVASQKKELESLRKQLSVLEKQRDEIMQERDHVQTRMADVNTQLTDKKSELEAKEKEHQGAINELQQRLDSAAKDMEDMKALHLQQIDDLEASHTILLQDLGNQLEKVRNKETDLNALVDDLTAEQRQKEQELREARDELKDIQVQLEASQKGRDETQKNLDKLQQEKESLERHVEASKRSAEQFAAVREKTAKDLEESDHELEELRGELGDSKQEVNRLEAQVESLKRQVADAEAAQSDNNAERQRLEAQIESLRQQLIETGEPEEPSVLWSPTAYEEERMLRVTEAEKYDEELKAGRQRISQLEKEADSLREDMAKNSLEKIKMEDQIKTLDKQMMDISADHKKLFEQRDITLQQQLIALDEAKELHEEISKLDERVQQREAEIGAKARAERDKALREVARLRTKLEAAQDRIKQLEDELAKIKQSEGDLAKQAIQGETQRDHATQPVDLTGGSANTEKAAEEHDTSAETIAELVKQKSDLQKTLDKTTAKLTSLETKLQAAEERLEKLQTALQDVNKENTDLKKKEANLHDAMLNDNYLEMKATNEAQQQEVAELRRQVKELRAENATLREKQSPAPSPSTNEPQAPQPQEMAKLQRQVEQLQAENTKLRAENASLVESQAQVPTTSKNEPQVPPSQEMAALQREVKQLQDENASLREKQDKQDQFPLPSTDKSQASQLQDVAELQGQVDQLRADNAKLQGENASLREKQGQAPSQAPQPQDTQESPVLTAMRQTHERLIQENARLRAAEPQPAVPDDESSEPDVVQADPLSVALREAQKVEQHFRLKGLRLEAQLDFKVSDLDEVKESIDQDRASLAVRRAKHEKDLEAEKRPLLKRLADVAKQLEKREKQLRKRGGVLSAEEKLQYEERASGIRAILETVTNRGEKLQQEDEAAADEIDRRYQEWIRNSNDPEYGNTPELLAQRAGLMQDYKVVGRLISRTQHIRSLLSAALRTAEPKHPDCLPSSFCFCNLAKSWMGHLREPVEPSLAIDEAEDERAPGPNEATDTKVEAATTWRLLRGRTVGPLGLGSSDEYLRGHGHGSIVLPNYLCQPATAVLWVMLLCFLPFTRPKPAFEVVGRIFLLRPLLLVLVALWFGTVAPLRRLLSGGPRGSPERALAQLGFRAGDMVRATLTVTIYVFVIVLVTMGLSLSRERSIWLFDNGFRHPYIAETIVKMPSKSWPFSADYRLVTLGQLDNVKNVTVTGGLMEVVGSVAEKMVGRWAEHYAFR